MRNHDREPRMYGDPDVASKVSRLGKLSGIVTLVLFIADRLNDGINLLVVWWPTLALTTICFAMWVWFRPGKTDFATRFFMMIFHLIPVAMTVLPIVAYILNWTWGGYSPPDMRGT